MLHLKVFSHTLNPRHLLTDPLLKAALGSQQGTDFEGLEIEPQFLGHLEQGSANSVKAQIVNFVRFAGHKVSTATTQ